jgi:hypothetical protein
MLSGCKCGFKCGGMLRGGGGYCEYCGADVDYGADVAAGVEQAGY